MDRYLHLQELDLVDCNHGDQDNNASSIDMLIYWDIVTRDLVRAEKGPVAVSSKFGWLLSGPNQTRSNYVVSNMIIEGVDYNQIAVHEEVDLIKALHQFWDTEAIGINAASPGDFFPSIMFAG